MERRVALKWIAAATASAPLLSQDGLNAAATPTGQGYGPDPDILKIYKPGDLWPLTFSDAQRELVITLCDIIIPEDEGSPSASSQGVHDFIDEWVSSPYQNQKKDRNLILKGLDWLDEEAKSQGSASFVALSEDAQMGICKDLAKQALQNSKEFPGSFFNRMRDLVAGGFYTTPVGMRDIGYVGNIPQSIAPGPTPEALEHLGLSPE